MQYKRRVESGAVCAHTCACRLRRGGLRRLDGSGRRRGRLLHAADVEHQRPDAGADDQPARTANVRHDMTGWRSRGMRLCVLWTSDPAQGPQNVALPTTLQQRGSPFPAGLERGFMHIRCTEPRGNSPLVMPHLCDQPQERRMRPMARTRCRPGASVASSCRVAASQTLTEPSSHLEHP